MNECGGLTKHWRIGELVSKTAIAEADCPGSAPSSPNNQKMRHPAL